MYNLYNLQILQHNNRMLVFSSISCVCFNFFCAIGLLPELDLFQIDDGYQRHWGDWTTLDSSKFSPDGKGKRSEEGGSALR